MKRIELTGIYIKDENQQVTGFFSQVPEAVAQGDTFEETEKRLFDVLPDIFELRDRMSAEDINNQFTGNVYKKSYSFQLTEPQP